MRKLIAKLGKETVTIAGRTEGKSAEKVKALGEALDGAAESHDDKAARTLRTRPGPVGAGALRHGLG